MFSPVQYKDVSSSSFENVNIVNYQQFSDGAQVIYEDPASAASHDPLFDVYSLKTEFPTEQTQVPSNLTYNPVVNLQQTYNSNIQYIQQPNYSSNQQQSEQVQQQPIQYKSVVKPELPNISPQKTDFNNQPSLWDYQGTYTPYLDPPVNFQDQPETNPSTSYQTQIKASPTPPMFQEMYYDAQTQQYFQLPPLYQDSHCQSSTTSKDSAYYPTTSQEPPKKLSKWKEKVVKSTEVCVVCGDKSSGWHYNVLACEGCKGFFRRSIARKLDYKCKFGGDCKIDMFMRKRCQACRLQKCHLKGMKTECVEAPNSAAEKAERKRKMEEDIAAKNSAKRPHLAMPEARPLTTGETDLINSLVLSQNEFEHPSVTELDHIDILVGLEYEEEDKKLVQMTQNTLATVKLIIEFTKRLPGFQNLCQTDQLILLKAASSETMMIRTARRYDPVKDTIVFSNNDAYDNRAYDMAGLRNDDLFQFCRKVSKLNVDDAEFAILTAVTVFSDRENLVEKEKVEQIQSEYVAVLRAYVFYNKLNPAVIFGSLLNLLVDLRSLAQANLEHCFSFKMKSHKLPPLLKELWDIPK